MLPLLLNTSLRHHRSLQTSMERWLDFRGFGI